MVLPMDCIAFILWVMIVYLNIYIAMNLNQKFTLGFILFLLLGPVASFFLIFISQRSINYEKTDEIYKAIAYIQKEYRFKLFNWKRYSSAIEKIDKSFDQNDLLKLMHFVKAEIEVRKTLLTLISIIGSAIITFSVAMAVYNFSFIENNITKFSNNITYWLNKYILNYYTLCAILIFISGVSLFTVISLATKIKLYKTLQYVNGLKNRISPPGQPEDDN